MAALTKIADNESGARGAAGVQESEQFRRAEHETVGRDEVGLGQGDGVRRQGQDEHEVGQRLHARPHHLPLQTRAASVHGDQVQGVPDLRLCLPHRRQHRGSDPFPEDDGVHGQGRAVLLVHRRSGPQEAAYLRLLQTQHDKYRESKFQNQRESFPRRNGYITLHWIFR